MLRFLSIGKVASIAFINKRINWRMKMKLTEQIKACFARVSKLNPHLGDTQLVDMVYQELFGAYTGTEVDKRNYFLCKSN